MVQIYRLNEGGGGDPLERIYCQDEDKELQSALEHNYDLLPGDQIAPDNPCRWLLIRREMPVPDPNSGLNRWNIDFLFADQSAIPTFVECKRFSSTQARREVVGQMLEYAANGHHYWSTSQLQQLATDTAEAHGSTIENELERLGWVDREPETYFQRIEENLREGQVRLVFFLEDASYELKSIVEFLNRQMERSEVLLIEARQYRLGEHRIVTPVLFGHTEEARLVKRKVTVESAGRGSWNVDTYFGLATQSLEADEVQAIRGIFDACVTLGAEIKWGSGRERGSFSVKWPNLCSRNLFAVYTDGRIEIPLKYMDGNERDRATRERLKAILADAMGLPVPEDYGTKYPGFNREQWIDRADILVSEIRCLVEALAGRDD